MNVGHSGDVTPIFPHAEQARGQSTAAFDDIERVYRVKVAVQKDG